MVAIAIKATKADIAPVLREFDRYRKNTRKASYDATDVAAAKALAHIQAKMRSVGLGKLANAVGYTSAKKKRQTDRTPYGVIFAKGGDESLAGGALESYSRGATITPENRTWLAVPTKAVPRLVAAGGRRRRLTPALWKTAGLEQRIGKLRFRILKPGLAALVVDKVSLHPKTGQAKALGPRAPRTRVVQKEVIAFLLIKQTRRAKRFDQTEIAAFYSDRVPDYMARLMRDYQRVNG